MCEKRLNNLMLLGFQQAAFRKFYGRYNYLVYQYDLHLVKCCLMCFIVIVKQFFTRCFDYGFLLTDQDYGLTAGVTGQQRMFTPPWYLILHSRLSEVRVVLHSILYVFFGL